MTRWPAAPSWAASPRWLGPCAAAWPSRWAFCVTAAWPHLRWLRAGAKPEPVLARSGGALREVVAGRPVDVMLYWQHWAREPLAAQRLTQAIKQAARSGLLQPDGAASCVPAQV